MTNAVRLVLGIIALIVILNIPILKIRTPPSVNPVYSWDIKSGETLVSTFHKNPHDFIYYRPLSGNYYSSYQYEVTKLGTHGMPQLTFTIPNNKDVLKSKTTAALSGKDGYVTFPTDGSFYLWYPRLGNQTFFYDKAGEFLWAHQSSHYIKAFPSGKFILSMTGDHSRAFYMLPDLSIMGSAEGTLLTNYQFSNNTNDDHTMKLCLGFLDGDIVFYNPYQKNEIRVGTGSLTKSLACNHKKLYFAVQMENHDKSRDEIGLGVIDSDKKPAGITWKFRAELPDRYTESLPVGIQDNFVSVLVPQNNSVHMQVFDMEGKSIKNIKISDLDFFGIEEWRIYPIANSLLVWNTREIQIYNPEPIYQRKLSIENVVVIEKEIFIQTPGGVIAYQLDTAL